MSKKGGRKLRSKNVRSPLTFAHCRFQRFLLWKARQTGAKALLINVLLIKVLLIKALLITSVYK